MTSSVFFSFGFVAAVCSTLICGKSVEAVIETGVAHFDHSQRSLSNSSDPANNFMSDQYLKFGHSISGSNISTNPSYFHRALLIGPIAIFAIGLISFIVLNFAFLCRCCCSCCQCLPRVNPEVELEAKELAVRYHRRTVAAVFYIVCILALVADQVTWLGNTRISTGVHNFKSSILSLRTIFLSLTVSSSNLNDLGATLLTDYNTAVNTGCFPLINSRSNIEQYQTSVSLFYNTIEPAPGQLKSFYGLVDQYNVYATIAFYVVWALPISCVLLLVLFNILQWRYYLRASIFWTMLTYLIELLVTLIFMLLTSVTADVCTPSPTYNILNLVKIGGGAQDLLVYYTSCIGKNVLATRISDAQKSVITLNATLTQLHGNRGLCRGNAGVELMLRDTSQIYAGLVSVNVDIACPPIRSIWLQFANTDLCVNLYRGFLAIWLSQLLTSFFLFMSIVFVSFTYQYFKGGPLNFAGDRKNNEDAAVVASAPPLYSQSGVEITDAHVVGSGDCRREY